MRKTLIVLGLIQILFLTGFVYKNAGVTNFDRLVLGSVNFGTDPNSTADLTFQNDEYISNATDGDLTLGGNLDVASTTAGIDTFTTTGQTDTVTISGASTSDIYFVTGRYTAGVDQQDVLQWQALSGKLVVQRLASGESALIYSWIRVK